MEARFIQEVEELITEQYSQLITPMRWSDSYEMYGERRPRLTSSADLSDYSNWATFKAKCKLCERFTDETNSSTQAVRWHYEHCSRWHGYVFDQSAVFYSANSELQYIITKSCEFDLPMPGYDDHSKCIKQFKDGKPVCVVHSGNEYKERRWLGHI
jgi:hypothetical protein